MLLKDFVTRVSKDSGFTQKDINEFIRFVGKNIQEIILEGEEVSIPHVGKICSIVKGKKVGRNLSDPNSEAIIIPKRMGIKLKPCNEIVKKLKEIVVED